MVTSRSRRVAAIAGGAAAVAAALVIAPSTASATGTCGVEADIVTILLTGGTSTITSDGGTFQLDGVECGAGYAVSVFASEDADAIIVKATGVPTWGVSPVAVNLYSVGPNDTVTIRERSIGEDTLVCGTEDGGTSFAVVEGDSTTFEVTTEAGVLAEPLIDLRGGDDTLSSAGCGFGAPTTSYSALGGAGSDQMRGTRGSQHFLGGRGIDALIGGAGPDYLSGGGGPDALDGGRGYDSCGCGPGDTVRRIENVIPPGD